MNVLGVNGWPPRSHDAAAGVFVSGRLVATAEEERFVRQKHAFGHAPLHAARFCLDRAGLTLDDIDVVAHAWNLPALFQRRGLAWPHSSSEALEILFPRSLFPRRRNPELRWVPHHLAHAGSAFHLSGLARAAILVLDGQGEDESGSLAIGDHSGIRFLERIPVSWSLGYFYEAVCEYVGFEALDAGKLMGLAAHGHERDVTLHAFEFNADGYRVPRLRPDLLAMGATDEQHEVVREWLALLDDQWPKPGHKADPFEMRDLAATAQAALETAALALVDRLLRITSERQLCIAGGVAFNATLNGKIARRADITDLFVQPLAGDAGAAVGAAAVVAAEAGDRIEAMPRCLGLGPTFNDDDIAQALRVRGVAYERCDPALTAAELISSGRVIGWFEGAVEAGPRALGHRSVFATPARRSVRERVNGAVKEREWWRPLAPTIEEASAPLYVESTRAMPYMIVTAPVRTTALGALEAVIHEDGTTRPQTVTASSDPLLARLLDEVRARTGHPAILNTSFNGPGEPIVCAPADAIDAFSRLTLDALVIGSFVVRRS